MPNNTQNEGVVVRDAVTEKIVDIVDNNPPTGKFRDVFPVDTAGDFGTMAFETSEIHYIGEARLIGDYVDDLPTADVEMTRSTVPLRVIGSSYEMSFIEEARGQKGMFNIQDARLRSALRAHEITHNRLAFKGAMNWGLSGLINNPAIPLVNVPVGSGGASDWLNKTPQEIRFDIVSMAVTTVENATEQDIQPNKFLIAKDRYDYIKVLAYSANDSKSVLKIVIEDLIDQGIINSAMDIMPMKELNDAGVGGTPIMVASRMESEYIAYRLPEEATTLRSKWEGTHWRVPIVSASGGLDVKQPKAHVVVTGI